MEKKNFYKACMILDKLQVELCEETPYEIPSPKETRERILQAMDLLEKCDEENDEED